MNDTTHNGWTNYATWRVNLEIIDGVGRYWIDARPDDVYEASFYYRDMAEEFVVGDMPDGLMKDYALAFLSDVNWYEIAKHMVDMDNDPPWNTVDDAKGEAEAPTNLSNT